MKILSNKKKNPTKRFLGIVLITLAVIYFVSSLTRQKNKVQIESKLSPNLNSIHYHSIPTDEEIMHIYYELKENRVFDKYVGGLQYFWSTINDQYFQNLPQSTVLNTSLDLKQFITFAQLGWEFALKTSSMEKHKNFMLGFYRILISSQTSIEEKIKLIYRLKELINGIRNFRNGQEVELYYDPGCIVENAGYHFVDRNNKPDSAFMCAFIQYYHDAVQVMRSHYHIMIKTSHERRVNAMKNPKLIRNICVIAHVDHGKTTLSDNLIGSNAIISDILAGKIRYLDSREDEQEREITMKSSAITLLHEDKFITQKLEDFELFSERKNEEKKKKEKKKEDSANTDYLINLIDSPGHVEFTFEVSSGLKVCDGAILVMDTYEGVCSQTITNLKKAVNAGLSIILVINKLDKFMIEEGIDPMQTYNMINQLISTLNASLNSAINAKLIEEYGEKGNQEMLEAMFEKYSFDPLKNNVIFGSAYDGWGFTLDDFTGIISKKYGFSKKAIKPFLWGDYYYNKKTKKISTKQTKNGDTPLFVKFILRNIYSVYETVYITKKHSGLKSMAKKLGFDVPDVYLYNADEDPQALTKNFMGQWLPLHRAIFRMVIRKIPNPEIGQRIRINEISKNFKKSRGNKELFQKYLPYKEGIENADEDAPLMAFVSKMIPLTEKNINEMGLVKEGRRKVINELKFYAFARIFSGKIRRGDTVKVHLLTKEMQGINKKIQNKANVQIEEVKVERVYIWMGQHLLGVEEAGPGCICGLSDLGGFGFKTVTISNNIEAPLLSKIEFEQNLLKVSLKTKEFNNMTQLADALRRLVKADPVIDVYYGEKGDLIIETGGEVHLQRCMKDLENYTQDLDIIASDPIITFKETIIHKYVKKKKTKKMRKLKREIIKENIKIFEEDKKKDRLKELGIDEEQAEEGEKKEENFKEEENDEKADNEGEEEEEIDQNKLPPEEREYRYFTESSSFFDTTSEEEQLDEKALENIAIDEWSDSGEGKEDFVDQRMETQESVQLYQDRKEELGNVTKKAKNVKFSKNKFVDLKQKSNIVEIETPNLLYKLTIQAAGMNQEFAHWLFKQKKTLKRLFKSKNKTSSSKKYIEFFKTLKEKLFEFDSENYINKLIIRYLVSFGPSKIGNNMLLCFFCEPEDSLIGQYLSEEEIKEHFGEYFNLEKDKEDNKNRKRKLCKLDYNNKEVMDEWFNGLTYPELATALESGFNIATEKGPLCDEEIYGSIFIVQDFKSTALNKKRIAEVRAGLLGKSTKKPEIGNFQEDKEEVIEEGENKVEENGVIQEVESKQEVKLEEIGAKESEEIEGENGLNSPLEGEMTEKQGKNSDTEEEKENSEDQMEEKNPSTPTKQKGANFNIDPFGPISGQILSSMKSACLDAFLGAEPRLVQGLFLVTLFCDYDLYGKTCEVLSKRKAKILGSEYQDITNMFIVEAQLPIQESFGFYEEMMIQTSGRVIPQLSFDTWSMVEEDPFYQPQTLDEVVEHGEKMNLKNNTRIMIDKIRESKGLAVDKKIVVDADKQDNIAKKR